MKVKFNELLKHKYSLPILSAIGAGLYPILYNYDSNLTLINSWSQFFYLIFCFLIIPLILFYLVYKLTNTSKRLINYNKQILAILNISTFFILLLISTNSFSKKKFLLLIVIACILGLFLFKYLRKIIAFQFIIAVVAIVWVIPRIIESQSYSFNWAKQPDAIENVKFKKRPNVYIIQPDGYVSFNEMKNELYDYDNSKFETFLEDNNFKVYNNFRSNYYTTLSSNTSMFTMKHHYYNNPKPNFNELYNAREIMAGSNPVVSIFKQNNYKTSLIVESPYLLVNRPKLNYNYCNINYSEIPFLSKGFEFYKNVNEDLEAAIIKNSKSDNFYFIEKLSPGHISTLEKDSKGKEEERKIYLKRVEEANKWLKSMIGIINNYDNNALIVIVSDHGGFVGFDYTRQSKTKQTDRDLLYSVFSVNLAIKWPDNIAPEFDDKLTTSVNLFRVLFSYLSNDKNYLNHLQDDKSFIIINNESPFGVYEMINEKGEIVFFEYVN